MEGWFGRLLNHSRPGQRQGESREAKDDNLRSLVLFSLSGEHIGLKCYVYIYNTSKILQKYYMKKISSS